MASFRETLVPAFPNSCFRSFLLVHFFSLPPPGGLARLRALSLPFHVCWGGGVSSVAPRAQLDRVGGSRWGWVLETKCLAIQTNVSLISVNILSPPSELVQGVAMSTSAATPLRQGSAGIELYSRNTMIGVEYSPGGGSQR